MALPHERRVSDSSNKEKEKEKNEITVPTLGNGLDEEIPLPEVEFEIPWRIKWASLIAIMLLPLGGYIIQGFGTALLDSCQHVIFHAFGRRRGLAFAFSLENAFANVTGAVAKAAAIPIRDALGVEWVFWIPVILCAISLLVNAGYAYYGLEIIPSKYRATSGRHEAGGKKKFSFRSLTPLPGCFWMLPVTQIFQSRVVGGLQGNTADIVKMMGYTEAVAGFMQSGSTILKILIGPLLGYAVDPWRHRFHYVAAGRLLWIICISLLNYSKSHPMPALVISAFAQTLSAGPLREF